MNETEELPSIQELIEEHDCESGQPPFSVDKGQWKAICGPSVNGVRAGGSPFEFVVVGDAPPRDEVGEVIREEFNNAMDDVFDAIQNESFITDNGEAIDIGSEDMTLEPEA
ncbi:MAG: hypothetical protein J07AB43_00240 [Candidatus Nanosalina sp. J07AB43]|nr:MAG: hypothetical protein J07AB43_00240 [Candidatus Nanosalina sp. J07AB43]